MTIAPGRLPTPRRPPATKTDTAHAPRCSCLSSMDEWYSRYAAALRHYLLARVRDPSAADECVSETFLRACAKRSTFHCNGNGVGPWLFTIARNIAHDYTRSAWYRYQNPVETMAEQADTTPTPEQVIVGREARKELARGLGRLPHDQCMCLRLRFFAGLSVAQTARVLRRRESATRALQYRAVRNLAKELAERPGLARRVGGPHARQCVREVRWVSR